METADSLHLSASGALPAGAVSAMALFPIVNLPLPLLHRSGVRLRKAGEALTEADIALLRKAEPNIFFQPAKGESEERLRRRLTHSAVPIAALSPGDRLEAALYDDEEHCLLEAGVEITAALTARLQARGVAEAWIRLPGEALGREAGETLRKALSSDAQGTGRFGTPVGLTEALRRPVDVVAAAQDFQPAQLRHRLLRQPSLAVEPEGCDLPNAVLDTRPLGSSAPPIREAFGQEVDRALEATRSLFHDLLLGRSLDAGEIAPVVECALEGVIRQRDLMTICSLVRSREDPLIVQSFGTAVVAAALGIRLGMSVRQFKALTTGALLADVGIARLPREIREKPGALTPQEFEVVRNHPAVSLHLLSRVQGLPAEVPLIVYQHHEKLNGGGYPAGSSGAEIHTFAHIVTVAGAFVAMCSPRPWRSAYDPYRAVEALVYDCSRGEVRSSVVRALLANFSMFPVGSWVELSDGTIGRVVAANPGDYFRPVIALPPEGDRAEGRRIDLALRAELIVLRPAEPAKVPHTDPLYGIGVPARASGPRRRDSMERIPTAWGEFAAVFTARGLASLGWPPAGAEAAAPSRRGLRLARELDDYFAGRRRRFTVTVDLASGSPFERRVWTALRRVEWGRTVTYGELGRSIGCASARAVGGACGRNPVILLVPCHRVVAAGGLGGWSGPAGLKERLLALEGAASLSLAPSAPSR